MTAGSTRTTALADGRRVDSARRRQRVIAAINRAVTDGTEASVSAIARAAAVDRTFLYPAPRPARQDPRHPGRPARH